jgi:hypothetical protein
MLPQMFFAEKIRKSPLQGLASNAKKDDQCSMANIIAFILGAIALLFAIPAFIPLLGALNWLIILIAGVGVVFGMASSRNGGRNFCIGVVILCALRLWLGGGLI